jgi:hypothetical protein
MVAMVRHHPMRPLGLADVEAEVVVGMAVEEAGMVMVGTAVVVGVVGMIVIAVGTTVKVEALGIGSQTLEGIAVTVEMTDTMTADIPESVRTMAGREDTAVAAAAVEVTATVEDTRRNPPL